MSDTSCLRQIGGEGNRCQGRADFRDNAIRIRGHIRCRTQYINWKRLKNRFNRNQAI